MLHKRALYRDADTSFVLMCELALTPVIFAGFGYLLDRWLGITPAITVVFFLWATGVVAWRGWQRYDASMTAAEAELPARGMDRTQRPSASTVRPATNRTPVRTGRR